MPIRKQDYPPNWKEISLQVRTEAGNRCEWCLARNGRIILRHGPHDPTGWTEIAQVIETTGEVVEAETLSWARLRFHGLTKIILTVAHLDRDSRNNDRSNLAALCQRCHLRHDVHQHIANRRYGRYHAKAQQLKLI